MIALRSIEGGSTPVPLISASADLERAWAAVRDAADAFAELARADGRAWLKVAPSV